MFRQVGEGERRDRAFPPRASFDDARDYCLDVAEKTLLAVRTRLGAFDASVLARTVAVTPSEIWALHGMELTKGFFAERAPAFQRNPADPGPEGAQNPRFQGHCGKGHVVRWHGLEHPAAGTPLGDHFGGKAYWEALARGEEWAVRAHFFGATAVNGCGLGKLMEAGYSVRKRTADDMEMDTAALVLVGMKRGKAPRTQSGAVREALAAAAARQAQKADARAAETPVAKEAPAVVPVAKVAPPAVARAAGDAWPVALKKAQAVAAVAREKNAAELAANLAKVWADARAAKAAREKARADARAPAREKALADARAAREKALADEPPKPSVFAQQLAFLLDESDDEYPIACDCSGGVFGIVIRDQDALLELVEWRFRINPRLHDFMKGFDEHGFAATRVSSSGLIKYVHPSVNCADDVESLTPTATKRKAARTTGGAAPKRGKASPL